MNVFKIGLLYNEFVLLKELKTCSETCFLVDHKIFKSYISCMEKSPKILMFQKKNVFHYEAHFSLF